MFNLKFTIMKLKSFFWCLLSVMMASAVTVAFSSCGEEEDKVSVSTTSVNFGKDGGAQQVSINSNTSWTVSGATGWFTVSPMSGSENGTITITATANSSSSERSGTLVVSAGKAMQTITVTQSSSGIIPPGNKVTIRNSTSYTLSRFMVLFYNSYNELLSSIDKGTVNPGESVSVDIPTSAVRYFIGTQVGSLLLVSPYYDVEYKSLTITNPMIQSWESVSSISSFLERK